MSTQDREHMDWLRDSIAYQERKLAAATDSADRDARESRLRLDRSVLARMESRLVAWQRGEMD